MKLVKQSVELVDSAGGDLSVVNSARVSFAREVEELDLKDEKLIRYLAKHRHDTPFRHNFIQLKCKVPLFLARQLMKHQAGLTWNEESRRYIDSEPEFYDVTEWRTRPDKSIKQGSAGVHKDNKSLVENYNIIIEYALADYNNLIEYDVAPEMARMLLPQSTMVNFIWSGNLLAFFHVYGLRSGEGAQDEAKDFAALLKEQIQPAFPVAWQALEER
jgi:thymidylate synthase (FAD)